MVLNWNMVGVILSATSLIVTIGVAYLRSFTKNMLSEFRVDFESKMEAKFTAMEAKFSSRESLALQMQLVEMKVAHIDTSVGLKLEATDSRIKHIETLVSHMDHALSVAK